MKTIPSIQKYMTSMPHTIGADIPVKKAREMMRELNIRHLPVQKDHQLVGVLTDRDIKLATSFNGTENLVVEDVMTQDPFCVDPDSALDVVVQDMAEHKYGCAVIQQKNGRIVGIFTATDGMRVLGEILQKNYKAN